MANFSECSFFPFRYFIIPMYVYILSISGRFNHNNNVQLVPFLHHNVKWIYTLLRLTPSWLKNDNTVLPLLDQIVNIKKVKYSVSHMDLVDFVCLLRRGQLYFSTFEDGVLHDISIHFDFWEKFLIQWRVIFHPKIVGETLTNEKFDSVFFPNFP